MTFVYTTQRPLARVLCIEQTLIRSENKLSPNVQLTSNTVQGHLKPFEMVIHSKGFVDLLSIDAHPRRNEVGHVGTCTTVNVLLKS